MVANRSSLREQEEEETARLMKERQAKLLAMQEKTQNKQAEIDELLARLMPLVRDFLAEA